MTTTAGAILDRRLVATGETGTAEWRLIEGEEGLSNWMPCFEHPDGKVEHPKFLPLPGSQQSFLSCPIYETLYHGTRGPGKAVAGDTPVLTNKGWIDASKVTMKHKLVAVDGSYTEIKGIHPQGERDLYRITFDDGTWVDCDDNHLWDVKQARYGKKDDWRTRSTKHIREKMQEWGEKKTGKSDYFYIPVMEGPAPAHYKNGQPNRFEGQLRLVAGARDTKDIPKSILLGEPELRYAAAQAYMDNFGCVDSKNSLRFVHHRIEKTEDMAYLLRSLGCKVNAIGRDPQDRYRFTFQPPEDFVPFTDEAKLKKYRKAKTQARKRIVSVFPIGKGDAVCFEVSDKRRLFIIKDFIVTHNTMTLLMDFAADVNKGYGKAWRGILFRREYKDLDDVAKKIEEWFPKIFEGFRFLKSKAEYMAIWKDGESLLLRVGESVDDYDNYHGHEYPWIGFEELTQWEDDKLYRKMFSCNRTGVPGIKCRVRATTNPFGPGHNWVKKRFRLPDQDGKVIREAGHKDRVAIFGSIYENFLLLHSDPDYPQTVYNAATSHAEGRAWLYGDWEVTAGGMFDDLWESSIHVVPTLDAYQIPLSWNISRSYDHGQSHPFAVLWWAESSGEPIELPDGRYIGGQRGDLFLIHEWYGNQGEEDNVGLKMPSKEIATGIRQREMEMGIWGRCMPGPADTEIFNKLSDRENRGPSDDMEDEGIYWERADKSPGSRKRGYEVVRTKLKAAKPGEDGTRSDPGLFVCENCRWWIQLVPTVPRSGKDPDEIPDGYPDHLIDPTRYRVTWNRPIVKRSSF